MNFAVHITASAKRDLQDVLDYLTRNESREAAKEFLNQISQSLRSLSELPRRGNYPPELERIGIYGYRELHSRPYRIVYEIREGNVFVHCVLDARRDVQGQLLKRLVRESRSRS